MSLCGVDPSKHCRCQPDEGVCCFYGWKRENVGPWISVLQRENQRLATEVANCAKRLHEQRKELARLYAAMAKETA
jgi:hypothetical protein